jgi:tmRNA-binding protein
MAKYFLCEFHHGNIFLQNAAVSKFSAHTAKFLLMNTAMSKVFINKCSLDKFLTESMQYRHKVVSMKHA